jgi:hypothetical protein
MLNLRNAPKIASDIKPIARLGSWQAGLCRTVGCILD